MSFDLQPTLRGSLLHLRPMCAQDFDALYAVARDPLLWEQHPEPERWRLENFRRYFDGGMASGGGLVVLEAATGRMLGASRYHAHDPSSSQVEIGWTFLERAQWGGTANGELKRLMLDHAFRFVDRVIFRVGVCNLRSQRAVLKLGARQLGAAAEWNGRPTLTFALDRAHWQARPR